MNNLNFTISNLKPTVSHFFSSKVDQDIAPVKEIHSLLSYQKTLTNENCKRLIKHTGMAPRFKLNQINHEYDMALKNINSIIIDYKLLLYEVENDYNRSIEWLSTPAIRYFYLSYWLFKCVNMIDVVLYIIELAEPWFDNIYNEQTRKQLIERAKLYHSF